MGVCASTDKDTPGPDEPGAFDVAARDDAIDRAMSKAEIELKKAQKKGDLTNQEGRE